MPKPTFAIAVTFRIQSQWIEAFRTRVLQQARDSLEREPGCCQFEVHVSQSDPAVIFLYESYVSAEAFAEHRQTDHFADFDQRVTPWVESKEVVRLDILEK